MTLYNYVLYYQITTHLGRSTGDDVILRARRNVLHVGMVLVAAYMLCWTYLTVLHAMWVHGLTKYGDVKWNAAVAVNSCCHSSQQLRQSLYLFDKISRVPKKSKIIDVSEVPSLQH